MADHTATLPPDIPLSTVASDLTQLNASQLSSAIRQRFVSCTEVMEAYLDRIHRLNPTYNAIVSLRSDADCMADAIRADEELRSGNYRGWMHGMPHAIKDLANARGLPTSFGSRLFAGTIAEEDSPFVAQIRKAGAIFIGKTNVPEWGLGSQTYNEVFGVTRNACKPELTAGGSSGGAACALATRMLPVADGSDMMGSLRNPAAFNNVTGFRPSQGRVPLDAAREIIGPPLATDGPMGRTVEDMIRLMLTMVGHEPAAERPLPAFDAFQPPPLRGYRIGWLGDYDGYLATEPGVIDVCEKALASLDYEGAQIHSRKPDYDMAKLWQTWLTLRHVAHSVDRELYEDPEKRTLMKPELQWEIEGSFDISTERVREAEREREDWYRALLKLFGGCDILALPSAQVFPFPSEVHWPKSINGREMDTYHRWMEVVIGGTLAGLPVVNLPAGFDEDGRPMGMQFFGRRGQDRGVLEFALAYTAATDYLFTRPGYY